MDTNKSDGEQQSQSDKFKALARAVEADEACWDERLKKVAAQKPAPEKPE